MGKHIPFNKKHRLAIHVLQGESYAKAGRRFGISRQTSMDIAKAFFPKNFMLSEVEKYNVNFNDLNSLREAWRKVCHF